MLILAKNCFDLDAMYWLTTSSGVRITSEGFLFLRDSILMSSPSFPCPRAIGALCEFENYTFLPCTNNPLTRVTDATPPFDQFWRNENACSKSPSMYHFSITPCDLQKGTSLLWSEGTISVHFNNDMSYWASLFVLLIMIWLIINLGETLALIMEVKNSRAHNHCTVLLSITLTLIIIFNTPHFIWVTYNDLILFWSTVGYVWLYCLYHLKNPNTVNIIVGCLMLISARFYQTNETPYAETFLFLISARLSQKIYSTILTPRQETIARWEYVRFFMMIADVSLFILFYIFAIMNSHKEVVEAHLELIGILYSSTLLGIFAASFVKSKSNQAK